MSGSCSESSRTTFSFPPSVRLAHSPVRDGAAGHGQLDHVYVLRWTRRPVEKRSRVILILSRNLDVCASGRTARSPSSQSVYMEAEFRRRDPCSICISSAGACGHCLVLVMHA